MRLATAFLMLSLVGGFGLALAAGPAGATPPRGADLLPADAAHDNMLHGEPVNSGKVDPDTVYMMGGPNRPDGKFQLADGVTPDWQGWISADLTIRSDPKWHVSDWNGRAQLDPNFDPNHVMWCGELFDYGCPGGDPPQGYANGYDEWLDWYGTVANNTVPTNVTVTASLNNDSEPGYDFLRFEVSRSTGQDELVNYSGLNTLVAFNQTFTVAVGDYRGDGLNQIHLRFHGTSDTGWSDADCRWPTYGHSEIDNIQVTTNNGVSTFDDFEGGTPNWNVAFPPAVGSFAHVWPRLEDLDPCNSDFTPLVAWIDDGNVVPGTGGTPGLTWTYGPGGYVVNPDGGLAGPGYHLMNEIWSPPLAWPTSATKQYTACQYNFCAYRHLPLSNGILYVWHVRSSTDGGATWGGWQDDNFVYYGTAADWLDVHNTVTTKLHAGRTHVQVAFGCWDYGWIWGYSIHDPTPAPYFDNVRVLAYVSPGPAISARDIDVFQCSNFPTIGTLDYANLGNNSVRLDMASNISPRAHLRNDPGDSIVVSVASLREGAVLQGSPRLYYKLHPNHLFDAYRTSGVPLQGFMNGDTTKTSAGAPIRNSWRWDFPDSNFFFPGDVIHYYFEAQDNQAGDIGTTRMPADTTGFALFPGMVGCVPLLYPSMFIARALPSMLSAVPGDQPEILFWNDFADRGGENEWNKALSVSCYREGVEYDLYYTNGPSSGVGNGLGGRASASQLAGYNVMLYTSGDLANYTLSNGDFKSDPSNDIAVMTGWLSQGGKKWFCTGDDLAYDLGKSGAAALAFRDAFLPLVFAADDIRPLIQNQINPVVSPIPGNPLGLDESYFASGGCPIFNKFDAVQAATGSQSVASFQPVSGAPYPYAAALYVPNAGGYNDQVVFLPYDFMNIYDIPSAKSVLGIGARDRLLSRILVFFGQGGSPICGAGKTPAVSFCASNHPNPFNPSTRIAYSLPRDGRLTVKIYNVRGELVRILLDEAAKAGPGSVTWLGDDSRGQKVASGVYFYQVKTESDEIINKMTLVK